MNRLCFWSSELEGRREYVGVYHIRWEGVLLPDGKKDVDVRWVETRPDSEEVRADILKAAEEYIGLSKPRKPSWFQLSSILPPSLAGETAVAISNPSPSGRARVVVKVQLRSQEDLQACRDLEDALSDRLDGSEIGFVDGNDIGQGEFSIYCFGTRKKPLRDFVATFVDEFTGTDARLAGIQIR